MAEFASLDGQNQNIPFSSGSVSPMELTTPNSIITGTSAGLQALGAQNIRTDAINKRIVVNDGITNRVSFGKIGTGVNDWGLKVSQPNMNVDTATASQLIFNSSQDVFKIAQKGSITIPSTAQGAVSTVTVNHNLNIIPSVLAFVNYNTTWFPLPAFLSYSFSATPGTAMGIQLAVIIQSTTATTVDFQMINSGSGGAANSVAVTYYLLQETAN